MPITMKQVAERIKSQSGADGTFEGDASADVTGIAVTFAPTLEVLRRAADKGRNLIVTRQAAYSGRNARQMGEDPVFRAKQELIDAHKLVVYRFRTPWQVGGVDGQFKGLARALGWPIGSANGICFPAKPATTLDAFAQDVSRRLKIHAARRIGPGGTRVTKIALTYGMITTPQLAQALKEPDVDTVIIGEPVEWEASPYFQDVVASGRKVGMVVLGLAASEEPGCVEMAEWLQTAVKEAPVEFIPAGEPFAVGRWS